MNPSDVPPTVFVESALKAMAKANIEATVIYVVDKNGKRITRAATNGQPVDMARHIASVRIQDGSIERAAVAMHTFRPQMAPGETLPEELNVCVVCHLVDAWENLEDVDKEGHREIVKLVLGNALAQVASAPLVSV